MWVFAAASVSSLILIQAVRFSALIWMVYPVKQEGNINMLMQKNKKDNGVLAFREIFCRRQQVFEQSKSLNSKTW